MCERDSDTESSIATEQTSDSDRSRPDGCRCDSILLLPEQPTCVNCQAAGFTTNACTGESESNDTDNDEELAVEVEQEDPGVDNYDPHQHVPGRIDILSADGLVQMHDALSDENATKLRSEKPEVQATLFWRMVESGVISADFTRKDR